MRTVVVLVLACAGLACAKSTPSFDDPIDGSAEGDGGDGAVTSAPDGGSGTLGGDTGVTDASFFDPDAACATALEKATPVALPVDIIWVVDNSGSMAPAVAAVNSGLNTFAGVIAGKNLDYRVIMLSLRGATPTTVGGSQRFPICIPPPLAGGAACDNGTRFLHSSIDVKSVQPLEQLLGTMDQTAGYRPGEERGGEPWGQFLRKEASKTIVVVTDDNSRLTADEFEHFAGGANPGNPNLDLPPGVLDTSRAGAFDSYVFNAIYGWGSDSDPGVSCTFADQTLPASPGPTYTDLVARTHGTRAKICANDAVWAPFFDAVAQGVVKNAKLSCELAIPTPASGVVDPTAVNVKLDGTGGSALVNVGTASGCGNELGWYYDNVANPTKVELCPASCDAAQTVGKSGGQIEVLFGCKTFVK